MGELSVETPNRLRGGRQPEPGALLTFGRPERLEHPGAVGPGDARAAVPDSQAHAAVVEG